MNKLLYCHLTGNPVHLCHRHYSDSANGPTYNQQLDAQQIQSLIDQRIKQHLGGARSQHLDSRACFPLDSEIEETLPPIYPIQVRG
ncbi:hypothetical protein MKW92_034651 [Papaver armeniacum]|nr:hypothetical protein MKW92_034651 [Papaver armeniacum]